MAEYKDTDVILKEIYRMANCSSVGETTVPYLDWKEVVSIINDAPSADVVEVVRCKDFKHATFYSCKNDACYRGIICEYRIGADDENFFCSYGERK